MTTDKKLDHIAIAVKNIDSAKELYCALFGLEETHRELIENEGITVCFLSPLKNDLKTYAIELISPTELTSSTSNKSAVQKFIESKGEGFHHIAYLVENIDAGIKEMVASGAQLLDNYPKFGSRKKKIAFFHPKSTYGCLIELCSIS